MDGPGSSADQPLIQVDYQSSSGTDPRSNHNRNGSLRAELLASNDGVKPYNRTQLALRRCGLHLDAEDLPEFAASDAFWGTAWLLRRTHRLGAALESPSRGWLGYGALALFLVGLLLVGDYTGHSVTYRGARVQSVGCTATYVTNNTKVDPICGVLNINCLSMNPPAAPSAWSLMRCPRYCLTDWSEPVVGSGIYAATSRICAAATHAGAISDSAGGCFRLRFAGAQARFAGSLSNGVRSQALGWNPNALEFDALPGGAQCSQGVVYINLFIGLAGAVVFLLVRPPARMVVSCGFGLAYYTSDHIARGSTNFSCYAAAAAAAAAAVDVDGNKTRSPPFCCARAGCTVCSQTKPTAPAAHTPSPGS
jgi:hypothetical protein